MRQLDVVDVLRYKLEVESRQDQGYTLRCLIEGLNILDPRLLLKLLGKINAYNNSAWKAYSEQEHVHVELLDGFGIHETHAGDYKYE